MYLLTHETEFQVLRLLDKSNFTLKFNHDFIKIFKNGELNHQCVYINKQIQGQSVL